MTTYTAITDAEIDQDSPITQTLMTKYRDNPIAMQEGATGAPKMTNKGRDKTFLLSSGGSVSSNRDFSGMSIYGGVQFEIMARGQVTFYYSTDNGSSWTEWKTGNFLISAVSLVTGYIDFSTGNAIAFAADSTYSNLLTDTATPPIAVTDLRFGNALAAVILKPYGAIS